jgi:hypothetical protein
MSNNLSYHEQEQALADAIRYKQQYPTASYRFLQRHFGVHKYKICQRFNGRQESQFTRKPLNTRLNSEQDKALCWFLDYLDKFGIPLWYKTLAADHILLREMKSLLVRIGLATGASHTRSTRLSRRSKLGSRQ